MIAPASRISRTAKARAALARQRSRGCRPCPLRGSAGECRDPTIKSGRCGDWVWYRRGKKQWRRLYVRPKDPRTPRQLRGRARFGAASSKYSRALTEEEQNARIAAGARLKSRPRLGQSGPLTGQQYSVRKDYAVMKAAPARTTDTARKALQTLATSASTSGRHRGPTLAPPEQGRRRKEPARGRHGQQQKAASGRGNRQSGRQVAGFQSVTQSSRQQPRRRASTSRRPGARGSDQRPVSRRRERRSDFGRGVVQSIQHRPGHLMFGAFIQELRARRELGLREFCLEHGHSPGNWSRLERGLIPPPRDERILRTWARQLGLRPGARDWARFFDCAAVGAGRIPDQILRNKALAAHLPAFFRVLSGRNASREDRERLLAAIEGARRRWRQQTCS